MPSAPGTRVTAAHAAWLSGPPARGYLLPPRASAARRLTADASSSARVWRGPGFGYSAPRSRRPSPTTLRFARAAVTSVLLVYPFFRRSLDRSRFRFPPLGIAYLAAAGGARPATR